MVQVAVVESKRKPSKKQTERDKSEVETPVKEVVVQETTRQEEQEEEEEETLPPDETPQPEEKEAPATPSKANEPPKTQEQPKQETQKPESVREAKGGGGEKKRGKRGRRRRRSAAEAGAGAGEGFKRYVYRVMKQVHPDMGVSSKAMTVINNFMSDMFERVAASTEAATLSRYTERTTLSAREVQGAVRLVLPGELGKHAAAEGTKAVANYLSSVSGALKKSRG